MPWAAPSATAPLVWPLIENSEQIWRQEQDGQGQSAAAYTTTEATSNRERRGPGKGGGHARRESRGPGKGSRHAAAEQRRQEEREINLPSVRASFEYLYDRGWVTGPHGSCWAKKKFEKGRDWKADIGCYRAWPRETNFAGFREFRAEILNYGAYALLSVCLSACVSLISTGTVCKCRCRVWSSVAVAPASWSMLLVGDW